MTFSRSFAAFLARLTGARVVRVRVSVGRTLAPEEPSATGVYALVSRKRGTILRVSCIHGFAQELADHESRDLAEASLALLPD